MAAESGGGVVVRGGRGVRPCGERQRRAAGEQPGFGVQLLPEVVPQRGFHRPQRHLGAGRRQPGAPRPPPPPPLPRLLRPGVRRVDLAGQRGEREDGGAEPIGGGIRGDRRHQDAAGAGVPGGGVVRGHRGARGARRRVVPVQGVAVAGGDRSPRWARVAGVQHRRAAVAVRWVQRPPPELRQQWAQPDRSRRALRGAHHRQGQLLQRHAAAVPGEHHIPRPAARLRVRQDAHVVVPQPVAVVRHRRPRRRHAAQVRQRLLHQPAEEAGRAGIRRRAHPERRRGADGGRPHQPDQVLRSVLHVHEEDGPHRRAHRQQRKYQEAVPLRLLMITIQIYFLLGFLNFFSSSPLVSSALIKLYCAP